MFCPKCGKENQNTNKFCKSCGKKLPDFAQVMAISQQFHFTAQPLNLIGQTLDGKYRIEAKLGAGGMGDVYKATRLLIGDTIAIKVLHPHLASEAQAAERFRREAQTAIKLRHHNVVQIYDVGVSAAHSVPYLLMELAEGFTLRQLINQNRVLPLDFVVTLTAQVCAALEEAHRLGIVHRDIKPENIIANQTSTGWRVKVLDFGIAKLYNQADVGLTQDGSSMGTPQYMSPEQCLGEPLDGRSDIYSLGITIYEMLCGVAPFKSAVMSAVAVHQVQTAPPPPCSINSEIFPQIETVILRALAKKREERQQTAHQLAQEIIQAATAAFKTGNLPFVQPAARSQMTESRFSEEISIADESRPIDKKSSEIEAVDFDSNAENTDEGKKELALIIADAKMLLDEIFPEEKQSAGQSDEEIKGEQPIMKPNDPLV